MATASPNYVLFLGTSRYLYRSANDATLSPTAAMTVSVTIDPEGVGAVTNGTIVSKLRTDNSQYGWKVEYIASTQKVKCTIYGNAAGTIFVSRETNTVVTNRANVTFTYLAGGTLNAYLNGVADNGTAASAGTFVAINASTEPLCIAADSRTGSPANVWKGLVYMVSVFDAELTSGNVSGQGPDGLLNGTMAALGSLKAYWRHLDITCAANNDFATWVDNKSSLALTSAGTPKAQQTSGTAILTLNLWDANLTELALGTQGLSSTYTLSAPYRLWGAAQNEPQISSGYRSYRGDFTAVIRARRVAGRSTSKIFRRRGIYFEYILASQEMYCIVGDDNVGSNNKRIGWGFKLFPVEGVDAVFVLRYNAVEKDIDLFINQIKYTQVSNIATTSNEQTTGLFLGESTDWQSCAITPMCLSDAQVDTFVLGLAQNTFPVPFTVLASTYHDVAITPAVVVAPAVPSTVTDSAHVPEVEADLRTSTLGTINYTGSPTVPLGTSGSVTKYEQTVDDYIYTDPLPTITTAEYVGGSVTVTGNAGPIEGEAVRAWAEIEIQAGEFQGVGDVQFPVALKTRQPVTFTFQTAPNFNAAGFNVRIAIQPQENARRVFYSAASALSATLPTDPNPTVISAPIASDATCTATANAGATNMGNATVWFEEETAVGSNTYQRVSAFDTAQSFAINRNHVMSFSLGSRTGHTGRKLRFAMQQESNTITVFYSPGVALTDYTYVAPPVSIQSWSVTVGRAITGTGRAGPTNVGPCSTWWELEITPGEFIGVLDKRLNVDLSVQTDLTDTFTIPPNFSLTGKQLRFAVEPNADRGVVYYSAPVSLTTTALTDPTPVITAAACSLTKLLTASVNIGVSNGGPATVWWELEHDPGEWTSIIDTTNALTLTSGQTRNLSYQLPSRLSVGGKNLRFAIRSSVITEQTWYSANYTVTQTDPITPTLSISAASQDTLGSFAATGSIGATNLGNVSVQWEVAVQGDFIALCEPIASQATSAGASTAVNANVSLPAGLTLSGSQVRLVVRSVTFPELSYTSSPFTVTAAGLTLPNPTMTVASETAANLLTLAGTTAASSITSARVWFQVDAIGGAGFDGKFGEQILDLSIGRTINASVQLPSRLDLSGRTVVMKVSPASRPDLVYTSSPLSITVATWVNPAPAVSAANVSGAGLFTATGQAGASDIGTASVWWEAAINGEFAAIMEPATVSNLGAGRQTINASVSLPLRFDLTGKSVRLAVQQASRPDNVYYSSTFPVTVTAPAVPSMTITAANVSLNSLFTASVTLGVNTLGTVKTWWEAEITAGVFTAIIGTQASYALPPGGAVVPASSQLPDRFDLTGKVVRFAIQPAANPENVYYSATHAIAVDNLTDPAPLITAFSVNVWGDCTGTFRAGPTNAAFCKVWWETAVDASAQFVAVLDTVTNVNLFTQQIISGAFTLPRGEFGTNYDYTGRTIRAVVQPNNRPEQLFYSPAQSVAPAARVALTPVLDTVSASGAHVTANGHFGPSNLGDCVWWVEADLGDSSDLTNAVTPEQAAVNVAAQQDVTVAFDITGNIPRMRLAVSPVRDRLTVYRSEWLDVNLGVGQEFTGARIRNLTSQSLPIEWLYELTGTLASIVIPPQATYYIALRLPNGSPVEALASRTWTLAQQSRIEVYWNGQWWKGQNLPPFAKPG